jgi:hypothetical protein
MATIQGKNLILGFLCFWLAGCAATAQVTKTPRSTIEQELLVRALDRAMAGIDTQNLKDKTIAVDFYGLTADKDFAKEYFIAWLQAQRVRVGADPRQAQLRLKVFASVLGVDQAETFLGIPAFTVPLIGFGVPEIPLYKNVQHSGRAEIKLSMLDGETGDFVDAVPASMGKAQYDDYTFLIIVHFTRSDLDKEKKELETG